MNFITCIKPHYSGFHADNEIVYILGGRGKATMGGEQVGYRGGHLVEIPLNTEHPIFEIDQGPVRAILVHFT